MENIRDHGVVMSWFDEHKAEAKMRNGKEFWDHIVLVTHCTFLCFTLNWFLCIKFYQPFNCTTFKVLTIIIGIIYKCYTLRVCQDNNFVVANSISSTIKT